MKSGFLHKIWRLAFCLFLAIVCSGQIYQAVHVHHFHSESSIAFKVSTHHPSADIDHASSHHHHEENSSHEHENEHEYKKLAVWRNAARAKASVDTDYGFSELPVMAGSLPVAAFEVPNFFPATLLHTQDYNRSIKSIRGPPLLA